MATLSVRFRDRNITFYFYSAGQISQLNAPVDVEHKILVTVCRL